jgi:hypothetical protein
MFSVVSKFVIPVKPHGTGREPASRYSGESRNPEVIKMFPFPWIPDLAMLRVARPE